MAQHLARTCRPNRLPTLFGGQCRALSSSSRWGTADAVTLPPEPPRPIGQGQLDEEELQQHIRDGRAEMVRQGFHGASVWVQPICWGDHDQFQHVNNVHYIRFIESSRMLFAEKMAAKLTSERRNDIIRGTGHPDTLLIGKKPVSLGKDRFTLQSGIYSLTQRTMVATSEETNVNYDYVKLCKIDMPDDFREALEWVSKNPEQE